MLKKRIGAWRRNAKLRKRDSLAPARTLIQQEAAAAAGPRESSLCRSHIPGVLHCRLSLSKVPSCGAAVNAGGGRRRISKTKTLTARHEAERNNLNILNANPAADTLVPQRFEVLFVAVAGPRFHQGRHTWPRTA